MEYNDRFTMLLQDTGRVRGGPYATLSNNADVADWNGYSMLE